MPAKRRVLIVSPEADLAGANYRIKVAFDKFSNKYEVRQVIGEENYIKYPFDIKWMGRNTEVNELYQNADLVHLSEYAGTLTDFVPRIWNTRKMPTVLHQQGTTFRVNTQYYLRLCEAKGWTQIVSTIDLVVNNEVEWVPNIVDIDYIQSFRPNRGIARPDGAIHVAHAPTNRIEKHTAIFEANMIRLAAENRGISFEVIVGQPWESTLVRKANSDLFYDQLNYGYGNNAIESMAMGIPTIGGFANEALYSKLPDAGFCQATQDSLGDTLREFVGSAQLRAHWGSRGLDYVTRVHEESVVVRQLERIYDETIERFH